MHFGLVFLVEFSGDSEEEEAHATASACPSSTKATYGEVRPLLPPSLPLPRKEGRVERRCCRVTKKETEAVVNTKVKGQRQGKEWE